MNRFSVFITGNAGGYFVISIGVWKLWDDGNNKKWRNENTTCRQGWLQDWWPLPITNEYQAIQETILIPLFECNDQQFCVPVFDSKQSYMQYLSSLPFTYCNDPLFSVPLWHSALALQDCTISPCSIGVLFISLVAMTHCSRCHFANWCCQDCTSSHAVFEFSSFL